MCCLYVLFVCAVCMCCLYVLFVCVVCICCLYVLFVCCVCTWCLYVLFVCAVCMCCLYVQFVRFILRSCSFRFFFSLLVTHTHRSEHRRRVRRICRVRGGRHDVCNPTHCTARLVRRPRRVVRL